MGMHNALHGKLILKAVPAGDAEEKVVTMLLKFAKTASAIELTKKVRDTPYVLSGDIDAEKALIFIEAFQKCGATAEFIPHVTEDAPAEQLAPVQRPQVFSFESGASFMDEETPPPIHVKPPKNGVRRLTMVLVIILLLLSLGVLTWQLWPIIGDKVQQIIESLKHNI
ncbi:MAG: hypothetical protein KJP23_28495 [Deltaproteobacteria bacterium]|nr:hypothetical protein [Deltaproteobacteria bacterium]